MGAFCIRDALSEHWYPLIVGWCLRISEDVISDTNFRCYDLTWSDVAACVSIAAPSPHGCLAFVCVFLPLIQLLGLLYQGGQSGPQEGRTALLLSHCSLHCSSATAHLNAPLLLFTSLLFCHCTLHCSSATAHFTAFLPLLTSLLFCHCSFHCSSATAHFTALLPLLLCHCSPHCFSATTQLTVPLLTSLLLCHYSPHHPFSEDNFVIWHLLFANLMHLSCDWLIIHIAFDTRGTSKLT